MKLFTPALLALGLIAGAPPLFATSKTALSLQPLETPPGQKPRVVITADPELDDNNSLIRYLLYSSDYRTEGLIYASSQFHWKGDGKGTRLSVPGREYTRFGLNLCPCASWRWDPKEHFIDDAVEAYAKAYRNLRVHNPGYPTPGALKSKIRWGNVAFDGEMARDTPGSDLIKKLLLDREESPVYLHAWGGQSTIARALKSIEEQYKGTPQWAAVRAKVIRKAVIHPSGDQDDTYLTYIKPNWPEIRYRLQAGGVPLSYNAQAVVSVDDAAYFTPEWTRTNVSDRGPLGALYRVWGDGKQMVKGDVFDYFGIAGKSGQDLRQQGYIVWTPVQAQGAFLGEGDTVTFLNLIDNGLHGYRGESFGGWGGFLRDGRERPFSDLSGQLEAAAGNPGAPRQPARAPTHAFLAAVQRDLAARFAWATTPRYAAANHNPRIRLQGPRQIMARPGARVTLGARTSDPDGDRVRLRWWHWSEAGSAAGPVNLDREESLRTSLLVPSDAKPGDTIQIVAEATDDGMPALTRYEKVVVTIIR